MKSIITNCFLLIALSITHPPSLQAQGNSLPFTANTASSFSAGEGQSPAINNFTCSLSNNKVILNWETGKNEDADQFEIEKSTDGNNFVMAALVFGTDKPGSDSYMFYEKATAKVFYRIKVIHKNKSAEYSATLLATKETK
ncbi:MAG: hypothetical protein ABIR18_15320 [Chitinophagaceae bacterium]